VVIPVHELSQLLEGIVTKHLQSNPTPAPPHTTQPKASFRTREQAAEALGISLSTLNTRLHDDKTIPFKRIGRRILIPESFFTALDKQDKA